MEKETAKETVSKNFIEQIIDKDLEEGKYEEICTRFPPEPNGYLHIGHAKSILLNYGLAQKYHGKFNMRFDDTNPTKEKVEFVESIKADIKWLGADWEDRLYFASDYFEQMYEAAVKLIKKGKALYKGLNVWKALEAKIILIEILKCTPKVLDLTFGVHFIQGPFGYSGEYIFSHFLIIYVYLIAKPGYVLLCLSHFSIRLLLYGYLFLRNDKGTKHVA